MTTMSPASIRPARTASMARSSPSKTRARPSKCRWSMPATLTTAPVGAGVGEHRAMARTGLGALVADDDDCAGFDPAGEDGLHGEVLAVEDAGPALELQVVDAGHLDHGPLGGEGAGEHRDAADLVDRVGERVDDVAVGRRRVEIGQVLGDGLARDGEAVAVEHADRKSTRLNSSH